MKNLKSLYERLDGLAACRPGDTAEYPISADDRVFYVMPKELLTIKKTSAEKELLMIAYFGDEPTSISYMGENANSMQSTVEDLRLPTGWPSNLGEKVFYLFRQELNDRGPDPISLEQKVVPGKEHQFEHVLKKLLSVYGREYAEISYIAENDTLSGLVRN